MEIITHDSFSTTTTDDLGACVDGMRRGDERALEKLYDATVGKVYAIAAAILRNAEDAEEVVCATYAYAWRNSTQFDDRRANPLGWLLMLCRSRSLDRLRQRRADGTKVDLSAIDEIETDSQPEDILSLLQQRSSIRQALSKLTAEKRRLISLAFLEGLSHQEIADVTGLALGTVKSHVRRALRQLRAELENI